MQRGKGLLRFGIDGRTLTPVEEKVLRMRHGIKARGFTRLETSGAGHPEAEEQLELLEQRLLAARKASEAEHPVLSTLPPSRSQKKS